MGLIPTVFLRFKGFLEGHFKCSFAAKPACMQFVEQARRAEEERLRQEELEKQRQQLLAELEAAEAERTKAEL